MNKRITLGLGVVLAAVALPAIVAAASNAYTSPSLKVAQAGTTTKITVTASATEDATARSSIYTPSGIQVTTGQAPGTKIGTVNAQILALALAPGGILVPLTGDILVAPPGAVPPATQAACTQGQAPVATWLLVLQAAGQTINLPAYLIPTAVPEQGLGGYKVVFCLSPPDIPVAVGGAPLGAKFVSAELTVQGVFTSLPVGLWIAVWTPWQNGNGQINAAGTVVSPARVAPGSATAKAKKSGLGAVVTGTVTQDGKGRPSAVVTIWGGLKKTGLKKLGTVKTSGAGKFTFKAKKAGTYYQARAVAAGGSAPAVCTAIQPLLGGLPCVNPTVNGFAAQSKVVAKR